MRSFATLLFAALAALVVAVAPAHAERRVALIIGNGTYQNASKLANPANDAGAMAALFKKAGFDVVDARQDLGNLDFKRAVRDFTNAARDADIAVVYYAGHGIEVGGINYLLPIDAKLVTDFDAEDEALSLDRLVRALEPAKRLRLVILDACRDNPFVKNMQRTIATRAVSSGLAKVEPTSSDTLIAFAAKAGSTAEDGRGANSPFTTALIKHIAVPGLDVRIAFGRVRDEVLKSTGNKQEPFVYGSLGGSTVTLVPEPKAAAPAVASTEEIRLDYEFAERVGTRQAWDSFLSRHKTGFHADLARAQRLKLGGPVEARQDAKPEPTPTPAPESKIAVLAPPPTEPAKPAPVAAPPAPDAATTRALQVELKRVGCDPGALDGKWSAKSRQALDQFNKTAGTKFDAKVASLEALDAVRGKDTRVCPLVCGPGQRVEGDACIAALPAPKDKPEARRPPPAVERALRNRPVAREAIKRVPERRAASCGPGGSPFTQGSRQCCEYTPERGFPRIVCP